MEQVGCWKRWKPQEAGLALRVVGRAKSCSLKKLKKKKTESDNTTDESESDNKTDKSESDELEAAILIK